MRIGVLFILFLIGTFVFSYKVLGQDKNDFLYPDVKENMFYETQWQYTYTLHVESQTIIHQAGDNFSAFYYFRLDHEAESFVNQNYSKGNWQVKGASFIAPILNPDTMLIVKINDRQLILETRNKSGKGNLQYFFNKSESKTPIFKTPSYLLPELDVTSTAKPKDVKNDGSWLSNFWDWLWGNSGDAPYVGQATYINIEMTGGGYFGGIDPPVRNFIQLKTDGKLIREYSTQYHGLTKTIKNIGRTELEAFAEYIDSKRFFELKPSYDCLDPYCKSRLTERPLPIPLRVAVTYGIKHKVVTIAIFGLDETNHKYLDYPPLIDNMVEIMNRMANRIE